MNVSWMTKLDTNVFVRFQMQDNPKQSRATPALSLSLPKGVTGFIRREVALVMVWCRNISGADICQTRNGPPDASVLMLETGNGIVRAAGWYCRSGPGFAFR